MAVQGFNDMFVQMMAECSFFFRQAALGTSPTPKGLKS